MDSNTKYIDKGEYSRSSPHIRIFYNDISLYILLIVNFSLYVLVSVGIVYLFICINSNSYIVLNQNYFFW